MQTGWSSGFLTHGSGLGSGVGLLAALSSLPSQFVILVRHIGPEPVYSIAPSPPYLKGPLVFGVAWHRR